MSDPGSSSGQFCGQCGSSANAKQQYCRSCGADLGVDPDGDTRATTPINGGSDAPPAAADRAGFPRWGWAALAAVVAVALVGVARDVGEIVGGHFLQPGVVTEGTW